MIAVSKLTRN